MTVAFELAPAAAATQSDPAVSFRAYEPPVASVPPPASLTAVVNSASTRSTAS
jgi:hypothetical protein